MNTTPEPLHPPSDELRILRGKKETLQNVIKIAKAVNRLQKGLQAALLMSGPVSRTSRHAIKFFADFQAEVNHLPSTVLQQDLLELDRLVRTDFGRILAIAQASDKYLPLMPAVPDGQSDPENAAVNKLLDEFRRRAQTAICLRIILRERGIATQPLALPVPEEIIQKQIAVLEEKERHFKEKIRADVISLQRDVDAMLSNPSFPDAIKHELTETRLGLQRDIEHIDAGRDLDDLPFPVEAIESAEAAPAPFDATASRVQAAAIRIATTPGHHPKSPKAVKRGFFLRVWIWANTPENITWDRTKFDDVWPLKK